MAKLGFWVQYQMAEIGFWVPCYQIRLHLFGVTVIGLGLEWCEVDSLSRHYAS